MLLKNDTEIKATIGDLYLRVSMIESASKHYREAITIFLREDNQEMPLNILKKLLLFNFHDLTSFENILISGGLKDDIISMYLNIDQKSLAANTLFATDILQRVLRIDPDNAAALALLKKEGILPDPKAIPAASGAIIKIEEMRDKTDLQPSYAEGGNSRLSEMVNEKVQENMQLAAEVSKLQDNVTTLSGRLSEQEELLKQATAEYEREKEEALAGLRNEYRLSEEKYETDGRRLQGKIEELITEVNEYARRLKEAEQGEQYSKEKLQEIIDQYSDLETRLLSKVHDMSEARILLDADISSLTAEKEDIRRDLSMQDEGLFREELAVAGADGEIQLESATPIITNRVFGIERRWLYYAGAFCLFLVLVLAGLTVKGRYSDRQKSVSYEALSESLARTNMADGIKVQATLVTHSLLSNGKEGINISKYDFKKSYYLRISINSQKRSLEPGLLKNPLESLRIQEGMQNVLSASDITIDEVKTVYRRNEPVLLSFLCSFPTNKVARDAKDLIFVLKYGSVEIPLVWDSRTLKTYAGAAF